MYISANSTLLSIQCAYKLCTEEPHYSSHAAMVTNQVLFSYHTFSTRLLILALA